MKSWYALMLAGGVLGMGTAGWQTVERIDWAEGATTASVCEISSVVSCSSVFEHWQSSALGIPNSLVALPVFAFVASAALAGLLGSRLSRAYLATTLGLSVFMTAFVVWYLEQAAFAIGVLCLFCLGCGINILLATIGATRVAAAERALGDGRPGRLLGRVVDLGLDLVLWLGLAVAVGAMLLGGLSS